MLARGGLGYPEVAEVGLSSHVNWYTVLREFKLSVLGEFLFYESVTVSRMNKKIYFRFFWVKILHFTRF
jgi:hypothetical protein